VCFFFFFFVRVAESCIYSRLYEATFHWFDQNPSYHDQNEWNKIKKSVGDLTYLCEFYDQEVTSKTHGYGVGIY
jgi:hypothetical protein